MQPTFVLEHPLEISPLAKPHRSKPGVTEPIRTGLFMVRMAACVAAENCLTDACLAPRAWGLAAPELRDGQRSAVQHHKQVP